MPVPAFIVGFLLSSISSGQTLSVGEIFDFDILDEFHSTNTYPPGPPNATRMVIVDKHYSSSFDTVFYVRSFNNYESTWNSNPPAHLDYTFTIYQDTVYYTNLNDSVICESADTSCITVIGTSLCGVITNGTSQANGGQFEALIYGKGCGIVRSYFIDMGNPQIGFDRQIFYFKKDTLTCGVPDSTTTSVISREKRPQLLPYPNPASDQVRWPLEPGNTVRSVTAIGMDGRRIPLSWNGELIDLEELLPSTYVLERWYAEGLIERARVSVAR